MLSETSMSAWIPALHTGMTQSGSCTKTHQGATSRIFKEHAMNRGREDPLCAWLVCFFRLISCSNRLLFGLESFSISKHPLVFIPTTHVFSPPLLETFTNCNRWIERRLS